jgi:transketolase
MTCKVSEKKIKQLEKKAYYIRNQILDMCVKAKTGHVTSSFSCTELMVALYHGGILKYNPKNPKWKDRDRFILSKGQASVILYPILADAGFFPEKELKRFNQEDGMFGVHLQHDVPGAEITAGSLGHGFGMAAGLALAAKLNKERYMVVTLLGDGECYEGSMWETAMFASHYRLNNLFAIIDRNWMCATDFTEDTLELNPLDEKFKSFGWNVINIDGHCFEEILGAFHNFRSKRSTRPTVIIADTTKGKGSDCLCWEPLWHGISPLGKDAEKAKKQLCECEGGI